jgi:molecular chaperone DnaJ
MSESLYDILGVSKTASNDEIKKAFKKQAMMYHPDKTRNDEPEERKQKEEQFKKINEAYSVLTDEQKRKRYDMYGTYDEQAEISVPDILKDLFGGGMMGGMPGGGDFSFVFMDGGGGPMGMGGSPFDMFFGNRGKRQKEDVIEIPITLTELRNGIMKKVEFEALDLCDTCMGKGAEDPHDIIKCLGCNGMGFQERQMNPMFIQRQQCTSCMGKGEMIKQNKECKKCKGNKVAYYKKSYDLKIPAGVPPNYIYKMEGKGSYDQNTNQKGNLILVFKHDIPSQFHIDYNTNNITVHQTIKFEELLTGFVRKINIYNEVITIYSKGYFNPSKRTVVKGKGIPFFKKENKGDLIVTYEIDYPDEEKIRKYNEVFLCMFKKQVLETPTCETAIDVNSC